MKKTKIILIPIIAIILTMAICLGTLLIGNKSMSVYALNFQKVNSITEKIDDSINELILNKDELMYSSSPYVIVENNAAYHELVSLGVPAIKPLYDKIKNSSESGLREYIYAMAIEEIMTQSFSYKVNADLSKFKAMGYSEDDFDYGWATAKEFQTSFKQYMNEIPKTYENIKLNNSMSVADKENAIIELGLGVVPYIIVDIDNNNDVEIDLENTLINLLESKNQINSGTQKSTITKKKSNFNLQDWIDENKAQYDLLKSID